MTARKLNRNVAVQDPRDDLSHYDPRGVQYVSADGTILYDLDRDGNAVDRQGNVVPPAKDKE